MIGDFLSVRLGERTIGIPALRIREVVRLGNVTRVAGAPPMIAGVMNLRGQLITAIDLRSRLALPPRAPGAPAMAVIVEHDRHVYAFVVDAVGDVLRSVPARQEPPPPTLATVWRQAALCVQRDDVLTLILDVDAILAPPTDIATAA